MNERIWIAIVTVFLFMSLRSLYYDVVYQQWSSAALSSLFVAMNGYFLYRSLKS